MLLGKASPSELRLEDDDAAEDATDTVGENCIVVVAVGMSDDSEERDKRLDSEEGARKRPDQKVKDLGLMTIVALVPEIHQSRIEDIPAGHA